METSRSIQAGKGSISPSLFLQPDGLLFCHHSCPGLDLSQRRRAYSTNQITNHKPTPRTLIASDPTTATRRYPLRKTKLQDLTNQTSLDAPWWQIDLQVPSQGILELGVAIDGRSCLLLQSEGWSLTAVYSDMSQFFLFPNLCLPDLQLTPS